MEFYLAFGIDWSPVIGVLDKGAPKRLSLFPIRQAKRGVIGALQVNTTWRNEPRAREAERPVAPFGLSS